MDLVSKMKKVADFSNEYVVNVLKPEGRRDPLLDDWFYAFFWFVGRAFYRGRRDELSTEFKNGAERVFSTYMGKNKDITKLTWLKEQGFLDSINNWECSPIVKALLSLKADTDSKLRPVTNIYDRRLLRGALNFLLELQDSVYNIAKYTIDEIRSGNIRELYLKIVDIDYYGDKTACFYLRDMMSIFELSPKESDYEYIQPIDTWVSQVSERIGLISPEEASKCIKSNKWRGIVKQKINDTCISFKISPIKYNQGAWYIGKHKMLNEAFPN